MEKKKALFIGDSIVARSSWSAIFSFEVLNLGRDGDRIRDLRAQIDLYLGYDTKEIFVYIGINDLFTLKSVDEVFCEYEELILELFKNGCNLTLFSLIYTQMRSSNKKVELFNKRLDSFAKEYKIRVIDLNPLLSQDSYLKDEFSLDGLHLNTKAYKIWQELLNKTI